MKHPITAVGEEGQSYWFWRVRQQVELAQLERHRQRAYGQIAPGRPGAPEPCTLALGLPCVGGKRDLRGGVSARTTV